MLAQQRAFANANAPVTPNTPLTPASVTATTLLRSESSDLTLYNNSGSTVNGNGVANSSVNNSSKDFLSPVSKGNDASVFIFTSPNPVQQVTNGSNGDSTSTNGSRTPTITINSNAEVNSTSNASSSESSDEPSQRINGLSINNGNIGSFANGTSSKRSLSPTILDSLKSAKRLKDVSVSR